MGILAVTMQSQAAKSKAQPRQCSSVTVELQSRPMFALTLAHWGQRRTTFCHLVANQFDTSPQCAL